MFPLYSFIGTIWKMTTHPLVRNLISHPMLRFGAVGTVNTAVDFFALNVVLHVGAPNPVAVAAGYACGVTSGFLLNSHFVFQTDKTVGRYLKYAAVAVVGFIITELIVNGIAGSNASRLHINEAKLAAVVIVFFWNYGMSKVWAFK